MQGRPAEFMRRFPSDTYRESMKFDEIEKKEKKRRNSRINCLETRHSVGHSTTVNIARSYEKQTVIISM